MQQNTHTIPIDKIVKEFDSNLAKGLSTNQVKISQEKYGANILNTTKKKKWWMVFLEQYKDVLMLVLIGASIISLIVSIFPTDGVSWWGKELTKIEGWENFILIVAVTLINSTLGTVQTIKSQKSLDSLRQLTSPKSKVIRDGMLNMIDTKELVVGDIILLEAGDLISADARVFESHSLSVNESSLTGESTAVTKNIDLISKDNISIGDRLNSVFSGCLVTYGRAKAIVTAVGNDTEIGKINKLLIETKDQKTPLQVNLDKLAKFLMYVILVICVIIFAVNISKIAFTDKSTTEILKVFSTSLNFSIALAIAVVPEALSTIVTIVLSLSTKKMVKHNAIVKDLKAVEGLGSVSIICSDKTGTITQNKMSVKGFYINGKIIDSDNFDGKNNDHLKLVWYSVLSSDAKVKGTSIIGDPTEVCLVEYLHKYNFDSTKLEHDNPRLSELSFDSERMMMSTLIKSNNKDKIMLTKGAVDKILPKCTSILKNGQIFKITQNDIKNILDANKTFSNEGRRVLCFVYKNFSKDKLTFSDEEDFTFIGLISMIDPPRLEVIEAIKECHSAGIKVVMITGDHQDTAVAIAKEIGIFNHNDWSMNGTQLSNIKEDQLVHNVAKYAVYARVSPEDKIKIVRAWQSKNMIVSMTGDGVNDAPSLKQANIGVAMGITGTEVAKDAASIILSDDNFATIVTAIRFGRNVYNNIKNAIKFLLTGNLATIIISIVILLFSIGINITATPFSPIQLLFLNLLTDSFPAISLGISKYKNNVMKEKPRLANEVFMNKKFCIKILIDALIMSVVVLLAFFIIYYSSLFDANTATLHKFEVASGMAFMTLSFSRFIHGFNCTSNRFILFSKELYENYFLILSMILGIALMSIIFYAPPLQNLFFNIEGTVKFDFANYQYILIWLALLCSILMLLLDQNAKLIKQYYYQRKNISLINL